MSMCVHLCSAGRYKSIEEFYSLLDSYGYVVYENKKVLKKSFPKNIFSSDEKFSVEFFDTLILVRFSKEFPKLHCNLGNSLLNPTKIP